MDPKVTDRGHRFGSGYDGHLCVCTRIMRMNGFTSWQHCKRQIRQQVWLIARRSQMDRRGVNWLICKYTKRAMKESGAGDGSRQIWTHTEMMWIDVEFKNETVQGNVSAEAAGESRSVQSEQRGRRRMLPNIGIHCSSFTSVYLSLSLPNMFPHCMKKMNSVSSRLSLFNLYTSFFRKLYPSLKDRNDEGRESL